MIVTLDPTNASIAQRIVEIQRVAYAVEAEMIGFDGIPQLIETVADVVGLAHLVWRGAMYGDELAGIIAWEATAELIDIDRLAVDPSFSRQGHGRRLVQAVPTNSCTVVSTGSANQPAVALYLSEGFVQSGDTEIAPDVFTTQFHRDAS